MAKYIKPTSLESNPNTEDVIIGGDMITKKSPWVDVRAYLTGGVSFEQAIENAINNLPNTGGTIYLPKGEYTTTSKITISRSNVSLYCDCTVIKSGHDGNCIEITAVAPSTIQNITIDGFLTIEKVTLDKTNGSIGLFLQNAGNCVLKGFAIRNFNYGIKLLGNGKGCVYNLLEPREMGNNLKQMYFKTEVYKDVEGWANQNTVIGGRWWYSDNDWSNGIFIHIFSEISDNTINGNIFIHLSLEGGGAKAVKCEGWLNTFIDCRAESTTGWEFTNSAGQNTVILGTWLSMDDITDNGKNNSFILRDVYQIAQPVKIGDQITGLPEAPTKYISIGSNSKDDSVGIFLPVKDGTQNTRAWLKLDANNKKLEINHTWSTEGDLSY